MSDMPDAPTLDAVIAHRFSRRDLMRGSLAAALACYQDTGFMRLSKEKVLEARGILLTAIKGAGLRVLPSEANFLFVEVPDANAVRDAMAKRGIAIRGAYGKWTRWSRVSTGKIEHVRRYAEALPQVVRA